MVKVIKHDIVFLESQQRFDIEINGKTVEVLRYAKQDQQFNDYELEVDIQEPHNLTEEEEGEVDEFVKEQKI